MATQEHLEDPRILLAVEKTPLHTFSQVILHGHAKLTKALRRATTDCKKANANLRTLQRTGPSLALLHKKEGQGASKPDD